MAKTLKFPLAVFLFLALAYIIPPGGVSALMCYMCTPSGGSTPCDKPELKPCKSGQTICYYTELPLGTVLQRGCEIETPTKVPGTCTGSGTPDPKSCYCNTDQCNFNTTTLITTTPVPTTMKRPTTTTTPRTTTRGSTAGTIDDQTCDYEADATSALGGTPFLIIISFASILFIPASFFDNN